LLPLWDRHDRGLGLLFPERPREHGAAAAEEARHEQRLRPVADRGRVDHLCSLLCRLAVTEMEAGGVDDLARAALELGKKPLVVRSDELEVGSRGARRRRQG